MSFWLMYLQCSEVFFNNCLQVLFSRDSLSRVYLLVLNESWGQYAEMHACSNEVTLSR